MVILILSTEGFKKRELAIRSQKIPVWVTSNVLTKRQIEKYRKEGFNLTVFDHTIDHTNKKLLDQKIEMIKLHHPGQTVTVQI